MFFTQSKRIIYALIVLTAVSWVGFGFIYSEYLRLGVELDQTNIEYEVSQILLNQTQTKLDNATRSLSEANETIEELSEGRIEILKALLQHHDLDTTAWEDMGVKPEDLVF